MPISEEKFSKLLTVMIGLYGYNKIMDHMKTYDSERFNEYIVQYGHDPNEYYK